jgi:hypothetical protein
MSGSPEREALVLRFPPGGPEHVRKILDEAKYTNRVHQRGGDTRPWYRLSVWVDVQRAGESKAETLTRLVHAAKLGRIRVEDERNCVFWWTTVGTLNEAGFQLLKDGEDAEPMEHYSVDLGNELTRERVSEFVAAFGRPESTEGFVR